jgi:hypothetical protein
MLLEPPDPGAPEEEEASWQLTVLPSMSVVRDGCCGCALSDGRFTVFGGYDNYSTSLSSCEALTLVGSVARWDPLPPMREPRHGITCAAIGGCVIVAGGVHGNTIVNVSSVVGFPFLVGCTRRGSGGGGGFLAGFPTALVNAGWTVRCCDCTMIRLNTSFDVMNTNMQECPRYAATVELNVLSFFEFL